MKCILYKNLNVYLMHLLQHDYTVGGLLNALGVYENFRKPPPYAATVFVELLSDSSIPKYVRISSCIYVCIRYKAYLSAKEGIVVKLNDLFSK